MRREPIAGIPAAAARAASSRAGTLVLIGPGADRASRPTSTACSSACAPRPTSTNQYPWGIWIAIDVASGVALAAGGFTTAALVDIFGTAAATTACVRPALLTAMLGYTFVVIGLLADLGRYYNVWHPMLPTMWQGNSVLFEVGICVMIYLTVLYIEFLPIVVERFNGRVALPGPLRHLQPLRSRAAASRRPMPARASSSLFIIAGVVLSCLHQSSLGTLMVIAPTKMHPLWYTPISPLLFLLSAIAVGFPMVIFESLLAARSFRLPARDRSCCRAWRASRRSSSGSTWR